jgi:hypothetical protein
MTCADLVATLEAPKAPPSSPTLEGETTLETFLPKQRRWLTAEASTLTHLRPAFLVSMSGNNSKEVIARFR